MARFPYHQRNVVELGKLIAKAALDESYRTTLHENPASELSGIGLPRQTTELIEFQVVDGKQHHNAVALPYRLNQSKLDNRNAEYLSGLSKLLSVN
ncbi:hypothetical protein [Roseibium sediminicola]|uniref:Uncharacterized protein n=1 Tax=Roseibium sediminicola TaxID=2933272 RepID=A0ABT0H2L2_9HYPH|nr:hypothetical protein [Roseibium sp. CAU 1639]MCK7615920.1 hypothetical protein [Roseibium sp. CAU 1639]